MTAHDGEEKPTIIKTGIVQETQKARTSRSLSYNNRQPRTVVISLRRARHIGIANDVLVGNAVGLKVPTDPTTRPTQHGPITNIETCRGRHGKIC